MRDLGTDRLTYRDLLVFVRQLPATSALYRAIHPDEWQWASLQNHLLAATVDALNVANWQLGERRRSDYPEPISRPGVEPGKTTYGGRDDALTRDEFDAWLAGKLAA